MPKRKNKREYIVDMLGIIPDLTLRVLRLDGDITNAFIDVMDQRQHEEIVRCKDCEYSAYDGNECARIDEWDASLWFPVEPDGFCAWGKRSAE